MIKRLTFIGLILLYVSTVSATDYYVNSATGNNSTGTGTLASPWQTITYALSRISGTGHTLNVSAGTYNVSLGEIFPITVKNGVSIVGDGDSLTFIDAEATNRVINCIGVTDASTVIEGFTITGGLMSDNYAQGGGFLISAGSVITIKNNIISNNFVGTWGSGGAMYISNSSPRIIGNLIYNNNADYWGNGDAIAIYDSSPQIEQNKIVNNDSGDSYGCVYIYGSSGLPRIINNVIAKSSGNGIYCAAGTPKIINNTISDISGNGIYISGSHVPDSIFNNIISFNSGYGIYEYGSTSDPVRAEYNLFYLNENGLYYDEGSTAYFSVSTLNTSVNECKNNIEGDPLFEDRVNNDYHLRLYSAAIDAGGTSFEYSNEPSPNGDRINDGAYGNTSEATITQEPPVIPYDIYVNSGTGSNTTGDGTSGNPWKTVTYALSQILNTGHIVHVAPGTYNTSLGEIFPIDIKNGVSLSGEGAEFTFIDADETERVINCIGIIEPSTYIEGFTITGGSLSDVYRDGGGIYISGGSLLTLRNNTITNNVLGTWGEGGGIYISNSSPLIINNTISYNYAGYAGSGNAIAVWNSSPLIENNTIILNTGLSSSSSVYINASTFSQRIVRNLIAKNSSAGIYCAAGNTTIVNNTISGNTGDGIYISSSEGPDSIINNIISYNSRYGIYEYGSSYDPGKVWYNLFYVNESGLYYDEGSTEYFTVTSLNTSVIECSNNIEGDPVFVDRGTNDYHLQLFSPAIDAGDPSFPPDPNGSRVDIGAFYFMWPPTSPVAVDPSFVGLTDIIADWNPSENATGYYLDLSSDINFELFVAGFDNLEVFNVTSYSITGLSANTTYYYRVRAYNIDGTSTNSNVITVITLSDLPDPPLAPDSYSATDITQTNFTANWSITAAATSYRLDVSADITFSDFLSGFYDLEIQNATSLNISGLSANSNYYYRVRASNSGGTSPNSEIVNVTTLPDPPLAPECNEASDISQTNFTANWNISATATGYFLDVAEDEDFTVYVSGFNNLDIYSVSFYLVTGLDPNTVYYYRVRAYNEGGTSLSSTIISVTTLSDPPAAPVATEASNIGQTDFMANWSASTTATGYFLDVAEDINFTTIITDYNNLEVLNLLSYTITGLEINTIYYYRVRAYNSGGISGSSNIISVTTLLNPPDPPSAPIEIDATEISQTSFTANWSSTESATGYQLDVATDNSFTNFVSGYNSLEILNATSYEISGLEANSYYYYRIRAYNSGGISPNSGTVEVITLQEPPLAPVSSSATGIAQTSFTANWSSSATAEGYYLDVASDIFFTEYVTGFENLDVLNYISYSIAGLEINTTYYYRVRAYNSGGISESSSIITVTTLLNPPDPPDAPIASDANDIQMNSFTANWQVLLTATGYRIDVAADVLFTTFVSGYNNKDVGNVTYTNVTGLNPNTTYYYRIRAYNDGGTGSISNVIPVKTLQMPPPSPTGLSATSCNDLVTLTWNASTEADFLRYRIYGGTTVNPTTLLGTTADQISETTKVISGLINDRTYYFRITTVLTSGIESDYSTEVSVLVKTGFIPKIRVKFGDILIAYNKGDSIVDFQWYNGNTAIPDEINQYYVTNKLPGDYHVFVTDINGCQNSSNIISISNSKSLSVYPNPANTSFVLNLNSEAQGKTIINLYNSFGVKVMEHRTDKEGSELKSEISVSRLKNGIYTIEVSVNNEELTYSRVVIIQ